MVDYPTDFEAQARQPAKPGGGAPLQISSSGLMKNFVMAGLDADPAWIEGATGHKGYKARKLKLPAPPQSGTYVLGCIDGNIQWIETEAC